MAALRSGLQKEVFDPGDEKLFAFTNVSRAGKKKKTSFLCVVVSKHRPVYVTIYKVKKTDKDSYKKRTSWLLKDMKTVDGKDAYTETPEFDLVFDKNYKWIASSFTDKNAFIVALWKVCTRYLPQRKPAFINVNQQSIEETLLAGISSMSSSQEDESIEDDYQQLAPGEEKDLDVTMSRYECAISNIEAFTEKLSRDLSSLDGANISSIMSSESQVKNIMEHIDEGLNELDNLEEKLKRYDKLLQKARDHMENMDEKNKRMQLERENHKKLSDEVQNLVDILDVPEDTLNLLKKKSLTSLSGIRQCTEAARHVRDAMSAELSPGLDKIYAVKEQRDKFWVLCQEFATHLTFHLKSVFQSHGEETETLVKHSSELVIPSHHKIHNELAPYTDLMLWLKEIDHSKFTELIQVYTQCFSKVFEKEIRDFFEVSKQRCSLRSLKTPSGSLKAGSSLSLSRDSLSSHGSPLSLRMSKREKLGTDSPQLNRRSPSGSISSQDSVLSSENLSDSRSRFDKIFDALLSELEPACLAEQEFIEKFFHMPLPKDDSETSSLSSTSSILLKDTPDGAAMSRSKRSGELGLYKIMAELFSGLDPELQSFMNFGDKLDSFNTMYMLVRIGDYVMAHQSSGIHISFLSHQLAQSLILVKRLFDKFIHALEKQVEETKVPKKSRCGILPFVSKFESFAETAETIFKNSERRTDLDKSYRLLLNCVFKNIERAAVENQKTPSDVIQFENYHHLYGVLSRLKIASLDGERKQAKVQYTEHMNSYATTMFGRPMEKLNIFVDGIEEKLSSGVKTEEIGYQLAFSKQELRKAIKEYPEKEVKKGLEQLYKKVEKHLSEEENLLQVVWRSMQEKFIQQYKYFDELINRCYPGSMITLDFSIDSLLHFFSDIAQLH